jgi:hypothetical protein
MSKVRGDEILYKTTIAAKNPMLPSPVTLIAFFAAFWALMSSLWKPTRAKLTAPVANQKKNMVKRLPHKASPDMVPIRQRARE